LGSVAILPSSRWWPITRVGLFCQSSHVSQC
jgi:hypothetical protein